MRLILLTLLLIGPIAQAESCSSAYNYLNKEMSHLEFNSIQKLCEYFDEVGLESEMYRDVYACRLLESSKCKVNTL
jgi:hypothetical protein